MNRAFLTRLPCFSILAGSLLLGGCATAPRSYMQLEQLRERHGYPSPEGRPQREGLATHVRAIPLGEHQGALEIALDVQNLSESSVKIEPSRFAASAVWRDTSGKLVRIAARIVDPDDIIRTVNEQRARVATSQNPHSYTAPEAAAYTLIEVTDLALILGGKNSKDLDEARERRRDDARERRRDQSDFETQRALVDGMLAREGEYARTQLWSSASLDPTLSMRRSLLVAIPPECDTLILSAPVANEPHEFTFKVARVPLL